MRHWAEFRTLFSAVELVICGKLNIFCSLGTTDSNLDKPSPDDATLPQVGCRTPRKKKKRWDLNQGLLNQLYPALLLTTISAQMEKIKAIKQC